MFMTNYDYNTAQGRKTLNVFNHFVIEVPIE